MNTKTKSRSKIADRIAAAFGPIYSMGYHELARLVFPPKQYPRAWRSAVQGGPPGCYMALSAALRKNGYRVVHKETAGTTIVWKKLR